MHRCLFACERPALVRKRVELLSNGNFELELLRAERDGFRRMELIGNGNWEGVLKATLRLSEDSSEANTYH